MTKSHVGHDGKLKLVLALLVIGLLAPLASSQGPSSLAEENEQLKQRVAELESQLEMARSRIDTLDDEVQRLRQLAQANQSSDPSPTPTRDLSDDPMASPAILFDYLKKNYTEAMEDQPLDTRADQARYRREVGEWVREMQRTLKGSVAWTIRVTDRSAARSRQPLIGFEVIDAATGESLGDAMATIFPSRFARNIATNSTQDLWKLEGQLSALPTLNARRLEEGDDPEAPKFIGPYAEYGFELAIRTFKSAP